MATGWSSRSRRAASRRPRRLAHVRQGAARTGRDLAGFRNCALTNLALLEPGEAVDSDRIKAALGPNVMASVYYFYDEVHEKRIEPPLFLARIWKKYCTLVEERRPSTGISARTNSTTRGCIRAKPS